MRTPETVYAGERLVGPAGENLGVKVTVGGKILATAPSQWVKRISPAGFEWGYHGDGPSQLALALLLDALAGTADHAEVRRLALAYYGEFRYVVANWSRKWEVTAGEVRRWVAQWRDHLADAAATRAEYELGRGDPTPGPTPHVAGEGKGGGP